VQVSITEAIPLFGRPGIPFVDLLQAAIESGRTPLFAAPAMPALFVGYEQLLADVAAGVSSLRSRRSVICGDSGSGVSTFAVVLAHRLHATPTAAVAPQSRGTAGGVSKSDAGVFSGGIVVADAAGVRSSLHRGGAVASAVCRSAGVMVAAQPADAMRAWCGARRSPTLLLVDVGADTTADAAAVYAWMRDVDDVVRGDNVYVCLCITGPAASGNAVAVSDMVRRLSDAVAGRCCCGQDAFSLDHVGVQCICHVCVLP
jgi:hypothetical protein